MGPLMGSGASVVVVDWGRERKKPKQCGCCLGPEKKLGRLLLLLLLLVTGASQVLKPMREETKKYRR